MITRWMDGDSLADGRFALTFDDGPGETAGDGPGPRTVALAEYLADAQVPATFFLCGKYIDTLPDVPGRLRSLGFEVGNHTTTHPHLPDLAAAGGDVVGEVVGTARRLGVGDGERVWFRPPYGEWDERVAALLDAEPEFHAHVGPVVWNVGGDDWSFWRDGRSPAECAEHYVDQMERARHGIVLLHDYTADSDPIRAANRTYETVRLLVPALRTRGFELVGLDEVP